MTPVYQTRAGQDGNCFAACVATLLGVPIEDVDVELANCDKCSALIKLIEEKTGCRIYGFPHEAVVDQAVKPSERYCIVEVLSCKPNDWHAVVCEITEGGTLMIVHNPQRNDPRKQSLQQFAGLRNLYIVKAAPQRDGFPG